jgi:O-antigen/teichoic acid export membrane protein
MRTSRDSIQPGTSGAGDQSLRVAEPATSLWTLLAQSISWVAAAKGFSGGAAMLRTVIFARLLRPYDFGVFGAAWFWGVLIRLIIDPNFETALVAQDEDMHSYRDTVWTTMLFRSVVIAVIFTVAAKPLAQFYKIPNDYRVFYAAGLLAFVMALKSPVSTPMIERNLHFHIQLMLNIGEMVSSIVFGLVAIIYWNDWRGLVASSYAGHIARGALSYWFFPYRPHLSFDRQRARRLFGFGRWITLRRVAQYAARDLGNLTVGHVLGAQALGEYQMALRLGEPAAEIGETASMVAFPLAARYRSDPKAVTRLLLFGSIAVIVPGLVYTALVTYRGAALISVTAGPKWLGAVMPFRTLCLYGLFSGLLTVGRSVLDGLNRPHESFWISIANAGILAVAIYPMTVRWGTNGAAIAVSGAAAISIPVLYWLYARARSEHHTASPA